MIIPAITIPFNLWSQKQYLIDIRMQNIRICPMSTYFMMKILAERKFWNATPGTADTGMHFVCFYLLKRFRVKHLINMRGFSLNVNVLCKTGTRNHVINKTSTFFLYHPTSWWTFLIIISPSLVVDVDTT